MDDGGGASANRSGLPAGEVFFFPGGDQRGFFFFVFLYFCRRADQRGLFFLVLPFAGVVVGPGTVRASFLCGGGHAYADGSGYSDYGGVAAGVFVFVPRLRGSGAGVGVGYWDWYEFAGAGFSAALS